jgi:hypothetical protein
VPPDYKGIASVINIKDLAKKFPDIADWAAFGIPRPGETPIDPAVVVVHMEPMVIVAIDVVVVIVDVVSIIYDKPIDLITRD